MEKALSKPETRCFHIFLSKIKKNEKKKKRYTLNLVFIKNILMEIRSYLVSIKILLIKFEINFLQRF